MVTQKGNIYILSAQILTMKWGHGVILVLAVLALFLMPVSVFAETCYCSTCDECEMMLSIIGNCSTVKLTTDIYNQPTTCIDDPAGIQGKTFDCQGHVISGSGYGIYLRLKNNTRIHNCVIKNFYRGISLSRSNHNKITYNTIENNDYGIFDYRGMYNTITSNTINQNKIHGFYSIGNTNTTLINNNINHNSRDGIHIYDINKINLENNNACGNRNNDFYCDSSSSLSGGSNEFYKIGGSQCEGWPVEGVNYNNCSAACSETDDGIDYLNQGITTTSYGAITDWCNGSNVGVIEYHCTDYGSSVMERICANYYGDGYICQDGACIYTYNCTDSDDGLNIVERGTTVNFTDSETDYCSDTDTLIEYTCGVMGHIDYNPITCPAPNSTCYLGECVGCTDSDGGQVFHVKGSTSNGTFFGNDYCLDSDTVMEYYCVGEHVGWMPEDCTAPNSTCFDGECIKAEECGNDYCGENTTVTIDMGYSVDVTLNDIDYNIELIGISTSGTVATLSVNSSDFITVQQGDTANVVGLLMYVITVRLHGSGENGSVTLELGETPITCPQDCVTTHSMYIDSCQTLDQPDATYYLTGDITDRNNSIGSCINIKAAHVTLDCQGHSIRSYSTSNSHRGISSDKSYTTIKNCIVDIRGEPRSTGIHLRGRTSNHYVFNNTVKNQYLGLSLYQVTDSVVEDNILISNNIGLIMTAADRNIVENNIVKRNTHFGIMFQAADSNQFYYNEVCYNSDRDFDCGTPILSNNNNGTGNMFEIVRPCCAEVSGGPFPSRTTCVDENGWPNMSAGHYIQCDQEMFKSAKSNVYEGTTTNFHVEDENIPIKGVGITPDESIADTRIIVEQATIDEMDLPPLPAGETYALVDISFVSGAEDLGDSIDSAAIQFSVSRQWVSENNIDPDTIKMYILEGNVWTGLLTRMTTSDAEFYYYKATANHLTEVVITGRSITGMQAAPGFEFGLLVMIASVLLIGAISFSFAASRKY